MGERSLLKFFMGVNYRICRVEDLAAIADLSASWSAERLHRNNRRDTVEGLSRRMGEYFVVAESAGEIVGFVIGEIRPCANNDAVDGAFEGRPEEYLEVQDLYVAPGHRGKGIGTRLMQKVVGDAEEKGLRCSMVYSANMDYVRIAKFYEKCGFRMWHIYMTRER